MAHQVTLHDVIFIERKVELPDECPKCRVRLDDAEEEAVREWAWSDRQFIGHLSTDADGTIVETCDERSGDEIRRCAFWCQCGAELVSGSIANLGADEPVTAESLLNAYCVTGGRKVE